MTRWQLWLVEQWVLIAGTGTIAYGYTEDGREACASGAGPILGDLGRYECAIYYFLPITRSVNGVTGPNGKNKDQSSFLGIKLGCHRKTITLKTSLWPPYL